MTNNKVVEKIKKGDFVDIGIKICGLPKILVVRTVHRDNTVTLENSFGEYYKRVDYNIIKKLTINL